MKHMKCKICGFEAGSFSKGVCIECQVRAECGEPKNITIERVFKGNKQKQLKLF